MDKAATNTDRELWREVPGDYYSPSLWVTEGGGIGMNVGGLCFVRPIRKWLDAERRIAALEAELARAIDELRQAVSLRDVFAKALVVSVDKTENLQGHPVDKSPDLQVPNDDMVICPNCVHQFRAIPVNVQHELAAERKRREDAEALLRGVRTSTIDQLDFEIAPLIDAHFSRYKD